MKKISIILAGALLLSLSGCARTQQPAVETTLPDTAQAVQEENWPEAVVIDLSDQQILVDGAPISRDDTAGVYAAHDIVYYEQGRDFTYGEGGEEDAHSAQLATEHTVVHITKPGQYALRGKLSAGQVAVDLGEGAEEDPEAVVTLILDNMDITCAVAPAVIFYHVYECGSTDGEQASSQVDTAGAGANVVIADGTTNNVTGSYVARIYQPDTVQLSQDGTQVEQAEKLHKYDGAFYSRMSMNVSGESLGDGLLNITAANEGLDSELHLTINGGNINIRAGNDGINTNEDGISVTTVNGGVLNITVTGTTGEGDGIDSNGWLVINGGTVMAAACDRSMDAGVDADMGVYLKGGTVIATGNMFDHISDEGQNYAVFHFARPQSGQEILTLKDSGGKSVMSRMPGNGYSCLVYSGPELKSGSYTLWSGEAQLGHSQEQQGMGQAPGPRPEGFPEGQSPEKGGAGHSPGHPGQTPGLEGEGPFMGHEGEEILRSGDGSITLPDGTVVPPPQMTPPEEGMPAGPGGLDEGLDRDGAGQADFVIGTGQTTFRNVAKLSQ